MGGKSRHNVTRNKGLLESEVDGLEETCLHLNSVIAELESDVINLKNINKIQCQRLGEESLLRSRIQELESLLKSRIQELEALIQKDTES